MPIKGARFRFRSLKSGRKQRLAFKGNKVVEASTFSKRGKKLKTRKIR